MADVANNTNIRDRVITGNCVFKHFRFVSFFSWKESFGVILLGK